MKTVVLLSVIFLSYFSSAQKTDEIILQGDVKLNDFIEEKLRKPIRAETESQLDTCRVAVYAERNTKPGIEVIRGYKHWNFAAEILILAKEMPALKDLQGRMDFNVSFTKETKRQIVLSKKEYFQFEKKSVQHEKYLYHGLYQSICQQSIYAYYVPNCLDQNFAKHPEQFAVRLLAKHDGYGQTGELRVYAFEVIQSTNLSHQAPNKLLVQKSKKK